MRLSHQRLKVMSKLLEPAGVELAGADIMRLTGLASGSMYPILYALEDGGLVESCWEDETPQALGRPRRRLYKLTAVGQHETRRALAELAPASPIAAFSN